MKRKRQIQFGDITTPVVRLRIEEPGPSAAGMDAMAVSRRRRVYRRVRRFKKSKRRYRSNRRYKRQYGTSYPDGYTTVVRSSTNGSSSSITKSAASTATAYLGLMSPADELANSASFIDMVAKYSLMRIKSARVIFKWHNDEGQSSIVRMGYIYNPAGVYPTGATITDTIFDSSMVKPFFPDVSGQMPSTVNLKYGISIPFYGPALNGYGPFNAINRWVNTENMPLFDAGRIVIRCPVDLATNPNSVSIIYEAKIEFACQRTLQY